MVVCWSRIVPLAEIPTVEITAETEPGSRCLLRHHRSNAYGTRNTRLIRLGLRHWASYRLSTVLGNLGSSGPRGRHGVSRGSEELESDPSSGKVFSRGKMNFEAMSNRAPASNALCSIVTGGHEWHDRQISCCGARLGSPTTVELMTSSSPPNISGR